MSGVHRGAARAAAPRRRRSRCARRRSRSPRRRRVGRDGSTPPEARGDSAARAAPGRRRPTRWLSAQRGLRLADSGDVEPGVGARVGAHDERAARVGHDPHAAAAPAAAARRARRRRRAGRRARRSGSRRRSRTARRRCCRRRRSARRCARGRPRAGRGPPRLDRQHRLGARHPPRDAAELARVAERLQVQRDDLRGRVLLPVLQQVVARQIGLVAERDERRQPDPAARRRRRSPPRRTRRSGTRSRPSRRGRRRARTSRSATRRGRVLTTPMQFGPTSRIPLERQTSSSSASRAAPSAPGLREPGCDHDQRRHAGLRALARHAGHGLGRHGHDRQVDRAGRRRRRAARRLPTKSAFGLTG